MFCSFFSCHFATKATQRCGACLVHDKDQADHAKRSQGTALETKFHQW